MRLGRMMKTLPRVAAEIALIGVQPLMAAMRA
jgi:hypothetical protein